jgi:hypothetical protein
MQNETAKIAEQVQVDELELLTDLLLVWCEKNGRDAEELLPHCSLILERYRSGADTADKLFNGL